MELCIGEGEVRKSAFKWNVEHLKGETGTKLRDKWDSLPKDASFFYKLRHISMYFRQLSKQKAKEHRWEELSARAKLEVVTASLHNDIYNAEKQGEVNQYKIILEDIKTRKTRNAAMRSKVKWHKVGDKCFAKFLRSVRQKKHTINYLRTTG